MEDMTLWCEKCGWTDHNSLRHEVLTGQSDMNEKPWWFPVATDHEWCEKMRLRYPGDAGLSDKDLREVYAHGHKYDVNWIDVGEAQTAYVALADEYLQLLANRADLIQDSCATQKPIPFQEWWQEEGQHLPLNAKDIGEAAWEACNKRWTGVIAEVVKVCDKAEKHWRSRARDEVNTYEDGVAVGFEAASRTLANAAHRLKTL